MPDRPQDHRNAPESPEATQVNDAAPTEFGASMLARLAALAGNLETMPPPDAATAQTTAPPGGSEAAAPAGKDRYRLGTELGRGGMGVVFTCRDADLGRDVAMKVLHSEVAAMPGMTQRFVDEARISGRLQHPGIAPVHEVGIDPGNHPYFTMKLVQGETFDDLLAGRTDFTQDRQRFLRIFEQVCQTMAYAHASGVLHRDLKPANIMVGAFGEVHVMDWGLASDADDSNPARAAAEAGTAMGTPAYMPPEQARGDLESIGPHSDTFALGGILAQLLTGAPPYKGTRRHVMELAMRGDLQDVHARLDAVEGEPELVSLCRRCLAVDPADRLADAGALAGEIGTYLTRAEERAHQAEVDTAIALGRAEQERRARWLTLALASTILVAAVGGVLGYTWLQSRHRAQANRSVTESMATANRLWGEAQAAGGAGSEKWEAASVAAVQARELAQADVDPELRSQVTELADTILAQAQQVERDHRMNSRLASLRLEHAGRFDFQTREPPYQAAFLEYGIDIEGSSAQQAAALLRQSRITDDLVLALDSWATARRRTQTAEPEAWKRLLRIANLVDAAPERRDLRLAVLTFDREQLLQLSQRADLRKRSVWYIDNLALILQESSELDAAIHVLETGLLEHQDALWLHHDLGMALSFVEPPRWLESSRHMAAALALDGGSARMWLTLGTQLLSTGETAAGVRCYRRSLELREDSPKTWNNLGIALARMGESLEAAEAYARAIELAPDEADPHFNLAALLRRNGSLEEALRELALAIERQADNTELHQLLGETLDELGRHEEAIESFALAIALAPEDPLAHARMGGALTRRGRHAEAIPVLRRALELRPDDWRSSANLADCLEQTGEEEEAERTYREAIRRQPEQVATYCNLGLMLLRQGRPEDALGPFLMCHTLGSQLPNWRQPSQAWIDQCLQLLRLGARLDDIAAGNATPRDPTDGARLAHAALAGGRPALAVQLFRDAFAADPSLAREVRDGFRASAARAAVILASDSGGGTQEERLALRNQALGWFTGELATLVQVARPADLRMILTDWLTRSDLASVREPEALEQLSADERLAWEALWSDVRDSLR